VDKEKAERNVRLWSWYQVLRETLLWGPIMITFLQRAADVSLPQIYVIEALCVIWFVPLEVPTGALADLIGRKKTVFAGMCLITIETVLFAIADSPALVWTANLTWVLGASLISGADTSLIYDTLIFLGRESEFKQVHSRARSIRFAVVAIASVFSGFLAEVHIRLPMTIDILVLSAGCMVSFFFVDPPVAKHQKFSYRAHLQIMKASVKFVIGSARVRWTISFVTLIGVASKVWFFSYNPYFELVGLPLWAFGLMFCPMNIVASLGSYLFARLSGRVSDEISVIAMIAFVAVPILVMGSVVMKLSVLLILVQNLARGYMDPFVGHFLHQHLESENRATVVSIQSAARGLAGCLSLLSFAGLLCLFSIPVCQQILGLVTLAIGVALIISYRRIFHG